jgi:DNA-directed RNA polymerase subunit RPC12/RpoP
METQAEEAYRCRRCGKRHFGKLRDPDYRAFTG